jgi:hypothetical protein
MKFIHRFLDAVESCVDRPIVGLPLRMIVLCEWHRVHQWSIGIGFGTILLAKLLDWRDLGMLGVLTALPSATCLMMLPPTVLFLLFLEWISGYRSEGKR